MVKSQNLIQKRRLELHNILVSILGSKNVYYQPPEKHKMKYPCIVYELDDIETIYADNDPYVSHRGYTVTVIDRDPDSEIPSKVGELNMCRFDRQFVSDNLYHVVYSLYF